MEYKTRTQPFRNRLNKRPASSTIGTVLAIMLCIAMFSFTAVKSYAAEIGNWNYTIDGDFVTISGLSTAGQNALIIKDPVFPESIEEKTNITIMHASFMGCTKLTGSLVIPDSNYFIAPGSFDSCTGFTGDLYIGSGVTQLMPTSFANCTEFKGTLTIPSTVTTLSDTAFYNCIGAFTTIINNSDQTIPANCFIVDHNDQFLSETGELIYPDGVIEKGTYVRTSSDAVRVTGISLDKTISDVNTGSTITLTATLSPANATSKLVTWSSSDTSIATVDKNGVVTGLKDGTAKITAKSFDGGKTATCEVTVVKPYISVTEIKLDTTKATIKEGDTKQLTATLTPENPTNPKVTWSSDNSDVAAVSDSGLITAKKAGSAKITATADGEKSASCEVVVESAAIPVSEITFTKTSGTIYEGDTFTIKAKVTPKNATDKDLKWSTKDKKIATVKDGVVTGVKEGTTTITATAVDGSKTKATFKITVKKYVPVSKIALNKSTTSIAVGNTVALTATVTPKDATDKDVTWTSSKPKVATVDKNGVVTGVKKGKAVITATSSDGKKTAKCTVTVTKVVKVKSIAFDKKTYKIKKGKTKTLKPTILPKDASNKEVTYKSSKPSVATVDKNGKVKAKKKGTCKITVTTADGKKTATCTIKVY